MKTYCSTTERDWFEFFKIEITEEQKRLLFSNKKEDEAAKLNLLSLIDSQRKKEITLEKISELNSLYNSIKPKLKEDEMYLFISMDVIESDSKKTGILNCRVNSEHLQIRF